MVTVITIVSGFLFIFGSIIFLVNARKRKTRDIYLWTAFVFFHGLHEIVEYVVESLTLTPLELHLAEQIEISMFAISAVLLVVASLQRSNLFSSPWSYYTGISLLFPILYYTWLPDAQTLQGLQATISFGFLITNFQRLLFGLIFGAVSVLVFLYISADLIKIASRHKNKQLKARRNRMVLATLAAFIFMLSEGFVIEDQNILLVKAITALAILIIPIDLFISQKVGLKTLIVFDSAGRMLFGYNFTRSTGEQEMDALIMTTAFLSAMGTFSQEEIQQGRMKMIKSQKGMILFTHDSGITAGLMTEFTTPQVELTLNEFLTDFIGSHSDVLADQARFTDLEVFKSTDQIVRDKFVMFT
ncbi:MAG: hypothetical protein ACFFD4_30955 [Candidatus Odinarchaeota archaeon]